MYAFLRNTHLILGLVFSLALIIYGVSSVRIARGSWFSNEPTIIELAPAPAPAPSLPSGEL